MIINRNLIELNEDIYKINEDYSIKIIREISEFERLKETWDDLAEKSCSYIPWLNFDWFDLCLQLSEPHRELLVLIILKKNNVISIAPLSIINEKYKGFLGVRKVELVGNIHSPIRNFIFGNLADREIKKVLSIVFSFFCIFYKDWDIIEFDTVPEENDVFGSFESAIIETRLKYRSYFCAGNWHLDGIDYPFSQYFQNLPKRVKKDINYCQRRLKKNGKLEFKVKVDPVDLDHYFDLCDEVREKSWKAIEKDINFNRTFLRLSAENGWLRLFFLLYENTAIACQKWIVYNNISYIFDVVYDQKYSKYSPGKILSSEISKYVIDNDKVNEIDFMRGDEPYKKDWTPKRRQRLGLTIFNTNLKGKFLSFLLNSILPLFRTNHYLKAIKAFLSKNLRKI